MPRKTTADAPAPARRRYDDACAAAHALDLIGERWALLVARELMLGPKRFTDLRRGLPAVSPNVLTQRLEDLEAASIVQRMRLPPPAASQVYALTEWGRELEPVMQSLGRWAARSPTKPRDTPMGTDSMILSLRTMFDGTAAKGPKLALELRMGEDVFAADVARGRLTLERGAHPAPQVTISADANTLAALVYGGMPLAAAIRGGQAQVDGDADVLRAFFKLFPLPPIADTTAQVKAPKGD